MDKLKAYIVGIIAVILPVAALIAWKFGFWMFIRLILSLGFLGITLMLGFFLASTIYAKSWKYTLYLLVLTILSAYTTYLCITWQKLKIIGGIIALFVLGLFFGVWYISEPDLGLIDRFKSAERLEREGNYKAAARKYEKNGDYKKAAEMYEKLGWMESAAWAYEKAEEYGRAAEMYERLYEKEKDVYYLKVALELWKKDGNMVKATECLEKYAQEEPWFWEDVGKIYLRLGDVTKARKAYRRFLDYCLKEAEKDEIWWKHIAEVYEILEEKEKAKEAMEKYRSCREK